MANLIIPAVGAAAGFMIGGGTTGAQIGWMAGSMLAASRQEIRQDEIGDLRVQTAMYGSSVPNVIGKQRVAGNIIWAAEKKPYEIRSRAGKGGPTSINTGYRLDCLIGICMGPIAGISRVWADGKLIIDTRTEAKPLIGTLYLGTNSQLPDATYAAAVGAANASAYRGLAYISLTNFDLGIQGRIPNFSFEVLRGVSL
jgi:hypothetical protein